MKISLDCMRDVLKVIDENTGFDTSGKPKDLSFDRLCQLLHWHNIGELKYTVLRLKESRLIRVSILNADNDLFYHCCFFGLTELGEKLLSEISSITNWKKVKDRVREKGMPTIKLVLEVLGLLSGLSG